MLDIDDIVAGVERILCSPPGEDEMLVRHKVYNIGNNTDEVCRVVCGVLRVLAGPGGGGNFWSN